MSLEHKINLIPNNLEDKVKPGLFSRIRKSLVGKIAAYSLVGALAFGLSCDAGKGCGTGKKTSKIAFMSKRDGNYEIYVMNADGSNQTNLTNNPADDEYPFWSPDGSKIVFRSDRDDEGWEWYVMNVDGSGQTRLTSKPAWNETQEWSPDGGKIASVSYRGGNEEIAIMNADGSGQAWLTNNSANDYFPAWSPDGSKIAFESDRDGNPDIYVMNADGSNQTNLTNNPADDGSPIWSPK